MRCIRLVAVLVISGCQKAPSPPANEAGGVLEAVQRYGADSIARRMDRDEAFGERVLNGISSGDSTWLRVAVALRPTGFADIAEALPISVAEALPEAPERVLALIRDGRFTVDEVCTMPFIEPSDSLVSAYYTAASAALARVTRPALGTDRDRCRAALEGARRTGAPDL